MANEISYAVSLVSNKGGVSITGSASKTKDMSGDQMITNVQSVGTSAEAVVLGDISLPGMVLLKNMDSTNYIEIALDSGITQVFSKLLAGESSLVHAVATIYAKANTAACNLLVCATED
jgi:hypothetical protein